MSVEDANDVAKALAAFGAPSIRYHSFGQGQVKPSSIVVPQREPPPILPPSPAPAPVPQLIRQAEPEAAPEPLLQAAALPPVPAPLPPMPPVPAFRRTMDPATMLTRPTPMPPPRPLSDRPLGSLTQSGPFTNNPNPHAPPSAVVPGPSLVPTPRYPVSQSAAAPSAALASTRPQSPMPPTGPSVERPTASIASFGPVPVSNRQMRPGSDPATSSAGFSRPLPTLMAALSDRDTGYAQQTATIAPAMAETRSLKEIFALLAAGSPKV